MVIGLDVNFVAEITEVRYYTLSTLIMEIGAYSVVIYAVFYALASTNIYTAYSYYVSRSIFNAI